MSLEKRKQELLEEIEKERNKGLDQSNLLSLLQEEITDLINKKKLQSRAKSQEYKTHIMTTSETILEKLGEQTLFVKQLEEQKVTLEEKEREYKERLKAELVEHSKKKDTLEKEVSSLKSMLQEESELRLKIISEKDNLFATVTTLRNFIDEELTTMGQLEQSFINELNSVKHTANQFYRLQDLCQKSPKSPRSQEKINE